MKSKVRIPKKTKNIEIRIFFVSPKRKYNRPTRIILKALQILPEEAGDFLLKNPIIFIVEYKANISDAFTLNHEDFKKEKSIIYLHRHIWNYPEDAIIWIIHHEIAHNFLGHKTIVDYPNGYKKQEKEADELVEKWNNLDREKVEKKRFNKERRLFLKKENQVLRMLYNEAKKELAILRKDKIAYANRKEKMIIQNVKKFGDILDKSKRTKIIS